jgi:transcriptional regulator with XRE-family HTH domain
MTEQADKEAAEGGGIRRQTVKETVAGNVRAYRGMRGMDQADLAERMKSLGIKWHRATVSEVEHGHRQVTITEVVGLALALDVTVEQLLDSRGPERDESLQGSRMILTDKIDNPDLPPGSVTALVCRHKLRCTTTWEGNEFQGVYVPHELVAEPS